MLDTSAPLQGMFATINDDLFAAGLECIGTTFFLLFGLGGIQAATLEVSNGPAASTVDKVLYISTCMGLSLLVSAWMFFRVTGALFNPNISLALLLVGVITPVRFVLYCIAQLIGAIIASGLILALTPGPLAVKYVVNSRDTNFSAYSSDSTVPVVGVNSAQAVFIEMFITTALVLAVLMLAAEKHQVTPFAPVRLICTVYDPTLTHPRRRSESVSLCLPVTFGPSIIQALA